MLSCFSGYIFSALVAKKSQLAVNAYACEIPSLLKLTGLVAICVQKTGKKCCCVKVEACFLLMCRASAFRASKLASRSVICVPQCSAEISSSSWIFYSRATYCHVKKEKGVFWLWVYRILYCIGQYCSNFSDFSPESFDFYHSSIYIFLWSSVSQFCSLVLVIEVHLDLFQNKNPLLSFW